MKTPLATEFPRAFLVFLLPLVGLSNVCGAVAQELLPTPLPSKTNPARDVARDPAAPSLNGVPVNEERAAAKAAIKVPGPPTPDYEAAKTNSVGSDVGKLDGVKSGDTKSENAWRYKYHQNHWWYWMPSNKWMVHMDNSWVDYDPSLWQPPAANATIYRPVPRAVYVPAPSVRMYSGPRYYYDEFYRPYGGLQPYAEYPTPYSYRSGLYVSPGYGPGYGSAYGPSPYYGERGGVSFGSGGVRIGIGF